ncbi:unnamed protein product [Lactuca saligna]|uniref:Uncharacterized protein n=1 Tax=Lactuca saligna TaxID=75948 RepID=A0AA35YQU2_LACSI|nr:unnamed protein product [Lactuca saligna]
MNKGPAGTRPTEPTPVYKGKSPAVLKTSNYDDLIDNFQVAAEFAEFSRHVFPKGTVSEMEAFTDDQTVGFMEFAYAQSSFFFTAGARHIHRLKIMAVKLRANERSLQQQIVYLKSSVEYPLI